MTRTTPSLFEQTLDLIRGTETKVRALLARAVDEGDYDEVTRIAACARELRDLAARLDTNSSPAEDDDDAAATPEGYPRFAREGSKLVMVGWSKKKQIEYTHVAPRTALEALTEKLVEASETSVTVPTHELLPLTNPYTGEDFPEYYARTFLRWLQTIGIVRKYGHRGYAIRADLDYETIIEAQWDKLPKRV